MIAQLSLKQPHGEAQHPYGSSRLPAQALQPVYAPGQQACPTGPMCPPYPPAQSSAAASPFAVCPSAVGPSFQQAPLCMPAGRPAVPSPTASRVASPTSVLEGASMLHDTYMKPPQRASSMSRTVSMQCLPHSWGQDTPMQSAQRC